MRRVGGGGTLVALQRRAALGRKGAVEEERAMAEADLGSAAANDNRLGGRELVLLQLLARGYAPHQVAALRGEDEAAILADLRRALAALAAATVREALAAARRRGLLV